MGKRYHDSLFLVRAGVAEDNTGRGIPPVVVEMRLPGRAYAADVFKVGVYIFIPGRGPMGCRGMGQGFCFWEGRGRGKLRG